MKASRGCSAAISSLAVPTGASPVSQASVITLSSWSWRRLCAIGTRSSAVRLSLSSSVASSKLTYSDTAGQSRPAIERVGLHHRVGQHGDLVARHVDGGQPVARHLVDGVWG
jgi:hypothetical protein